MHTQQYCAFSGCRKNVMQNHRNIQQRTVRLLWRSINTRADKKIKDEIVCCIVILRVRRFHRQNNNNRIMNAGNKNACNARTPFKAFVSICRKWKHMHKCDLCVLVRHLSAPPSHATPYGTQNKIFVGQQRLHRYISAHSNIQTTVGPNTGSHPQPPLQYNINPPQFDTRKNIAVGQKAS